MANFPSIDPENCGGESLAELLNRALVLEAPCASAARAASTAMQAETAALAAFMDATADGVVTDEELAALRPKLASARVALESIRRMAEAIHDHR